VTSPFKIAVELLTDGDCRWSNLGRWSVEAHDLLASADAPGIAHAYPLACQRLAEWVGDLAQVAPGQILLDLCVGEGGSVYHWLERAGASCVDAVELRPEALSRLSRDPPPGLGACLAADLRDPVLTTRLPAGRYDRVLCLDALYHVDPPGRVWRLAAHALKPGGMLGFSTLLRRGGSRPHAGLRAVLRLARIDEAALFDPAGLEVELARHGLVDMRLSWGTELVLAGFARFVRQRAGSLTRRQKLAPGWLKIAATARLAEAIIRDGSLGYAAVAVVSPERSPAPRLA
jgi:SAM-dependent methyltransferase